MKGRERRWMGEGRRRRVGREKWGRIGTGQGGKGSGGTGRKEKK